MQTLETDCPGRRFSINSSSMSIILHGMERSSLLLAAIIRQALLIDNKDVDEDRGWPWTKP